MADCFVADQAGTATPVNFLKPKSKACRTNNMKLSASRIVPTAQIARTNIKVPSDAKLFCMKREAPMPNTPPEPMGKLKKR